MREIIDCCVQLRPPASRWACCTMIKKEKRQKIQKKTRKGREEEKEKKKDSDASPNGSSHKKEKTVSRGGRQDNKWRWNPGGIWPRAENRVRAEGSKAGKVGAKAFGMDRQLCRKEGSNSVEVVLRDEASWSNLNSKKVGTVERERAEVGDKRGIFVRFARMSSFKISFARNSQFKEEDLNPER